MCYILWIEIHKLNVIIITQTHKNLNISDIIQELDLSLVVGREFIDQEMEYGFASDLMSDVLTLDKSGVLLITGLCNVQALRTAEMSDIQAVIIARGKNAGPEMISLAKETEMVLLESDKSVFHVAGKLYEMGLKPVY